MGSIDEWFYDAFKLNVASHGRPLSSLAFFLFKRMGLISKFKLNEARLARFLLRVEDGYPDNPYHNRTHAADVLRTTHIFLTRGGVLKAVSDAAVHKASQPTNPGSVSGSQVIMTSSSNIVSQDPNAGHREAAFMSKLLSCYVAAVAHDHEHQGLTNDFLIRSGADLAMRYNDMSPHEMHHVSSTCILLNDEQYNFFPPVKNNALKETVRRDLIDLILATDMKQVRVS